MPYELFEGKKKVRKVKSKKDLNDFESIKERFAFPDEVDLVSFCTAIALYKESIGDSLKKIDKLSLLQMANMQSFRKASLYDFIVMNFLDKHKYRLEEFEKYFYAGFKYLRDWLDEWGPDLNTEIELFSRFWEDTIE